MTGTGDEVLGVERLEGAKAYDNAIDTLIASTRRELRVFDNALSHAYNSVKRYELLRAFLMGGPANRFYLALHDASSVASQCPRLLMLLRQFSDRMLIHETSAEAKSVYDPFAVADESHYAHRFHHEASRGELGFDRLSDARAFKQRFAEIWEGSTPAASATVLGL